MLGNRFDEGGVVYHEGKDDELVTDGIHEVTQEVNDLWAKCQEIKRSRRDTMAGYPRGPGHHFPFSRVLTCHRCGSPYQGELHRDGEQLTLRLSHERRGPGKHCKSRPRSRSVDALLDRMGDRVMPHLTLGATWKNRIIAVLRPDEPPQEDRGQGERLRRELENLRKQYQWGDLSDDECRRELEIRLGQLKVHTTTVKPTHLPNLERAANFLEDFPALWLHPGVTNEEREALVREVFWRITIDGKDFVDIEPKPEYAPPFSTMVTRQK